MLTQKELEEIENLKPGFNIVHENKDYKNLAFRRVSISKYWAGKLLKASFILNFLSLILVAIALVLSLVKPNPDYYASTPSGKVFGPLKKEIIK